MTLEIAPAAEAVRAFFMRGGGRHGLAGARGPIVRIPGEGPSSCALILRAGMLEGRRLRDLRSPDVAGAQTRLVAGMPSHRAGSRSVPAAVFLFPYPCFLFLAREPHH
jgi:hypothetical protein